MADNQDRVSALSQTPAEMRARAEAFLAGDYRGVTGKDLARHVVALTEMLKEESKAKWSARKRAQEAEGSVAGVSGSPDETRAALIYALEVVRNMALARPSNLTSDAQTLSAIAFFVERRLAGVGEHRPDQPQKPLGSAPAKERQDARETLTEAVNADECSVCEGVEDDHTGCANAAQHFLRLSEAENDRLRAASEASARVARNPEPSAVREQEA